MRKATAESWADVARATDDAGLPTTDAVAGFAAPEIKARRMVTIAAEPLMKRMVAFRSIRLTLPGACMTQTTGRRFLHPTDPLQAG